MSFLSCCVFLFRLHAHWQRREAEQPYVSGRPSPGRDSSVPRKSQRRSEGDVTPGETPSHFEV